MTPVLRVVHLSKHFGGLTVNRDISLALAPGDRVALIGPNGAGKTTFVDLVSGLLPASAGSILIEDRDVTRHGVVARVQQGLVRTFQTSRLFGGMTPREHLGLAILQRLGVAIQPYGRFERMPEVQAEIDAGLVRLGIAGAADRDVATLAYGEQRLLEIAIALAMQPKILLLDEPAAGVPQGEIWRIVDALDSLPQQLAVLIAEHDMDLVFRFARHIVVLADGEVIFEGTPPAVAADARVRQAYLGSYAHARGIA